MIEVMIPRRLALSLLTIVTGVGLSGCASSVLRHDQAEDIRSNDEYESALVIKELPPAPDESSDETKSGAEAAGAEVSGSAETGGSKGRAGEAMGTGGVTPVKGTPPKGPAVTGKSPKAKDSTAVANRKSDKTDGMSGGAKPSSKGKGGKNAATAAAEGANGVVELPVKRFPEFEDSVGFEGRRPINDPYRVGEKVVLEVSYFNMVGGDMTLEVLPFVEVNGQKSYHFKGSARSSSVFALFYAVDDYFDTYLDFNRMVPFNYSLHVRESKQLREVRSIFDWDSMLGKVWDKKVTKDKGVEEKNYEWELQPFAQNIFTAPFYLRAFQLEPGKKIQFRIGHEGKNLVVTTDVIRREKLTTAVGTLDTVVVKPRVEIDGVFKPVGDIYFWLTDDDRKFIVQLESKIKIGKIVGRLKKIERGRE